MCKSSMTESSPEFFYYQISKNSTTKQVTIKKIFVGSSSRENLTWRVFLYNICSVEPDNSNEGADAPKSPVAILAADPFSDQKLLAVSPEDRFRKYVTGIDNLPATRARAV